MTEILLVGSDSERVVGSKEMINQIKKIKEYKLDLVDKNGESVTWEDLDDCRNKNTILRSIVEDRKLRIDRKEFMADRPNFCAITVVDGVIKRIEYYEGHDSLELVHDIRSSELDKEGMATYMKEDPIRFNAESNNIQINVVGLMLGIGFKEASEFYKKAHQDSISVVKNNKCKFPARCVETLSRHRYKFEKILENRLDLFDRVNS